MIHSRVLASFRRTIFPSLMITHGYSKRPLNSAHHLPYQYPCWTFASSSSSSSSSSFSSSSSSSSITDEPVVETISDEDSGTADTTHGDAGFTELPQKVEEEKDKNNFVEKEEDTTTTVSLDMALKPSDVVAELDKHIVGQHDAKRAVAIAMRNRWRRRHLPEDLRKEVTPRNVLLVGPTGCGKTEVARRMAQLSDSPFIKVEATKFTEVGYHGRDVDQIIRDLMDASMQLTRKVWTEKLRGKARSVVEDRILDRLTGPAVASSSTSTSSSSSSGGSSSSNGKKEARGRETFRDMLQQGILDEQEIEVEVPQGGGNKGGGEAGAFATDNSNPNVIAMADLFQRFSGQGKKQSVERKKLPISEARNVILEVELESLLEAVDLKKEAITAVEESGVVFLDEIDKICSSRDSFSSRSADASAEGVQRDLLPLIEGTTISTKYGNVNTDYILFVASGAFHAVKPSDLLPELQGRLPIRVELKGLTEEDLYRILTEPVANLVRQQVELIGTEGVRLEFEDDAIREIARFAALLNRTIENIGARRLHTVMERVMEELSFKAAEEKTGSILHVNKELVAARLQEITAKTDLSKYIL